MATPIIEPARREELDEALRLAFQHLEPSERDYRVSAAADLVARNELDKQGILVARKRGQIVGTLICATTPGAGSLVWPPQVHAGPKSGLVEDQLLQHACRWLRQCGAKLCQAMLPPEEAPLGASLERNGFPRVTSLWYMRLDLKHTRPARQRALTYEPYPAVAADFHDTLLATYEGTLDCPELTGARDIDDIIAGHRAQGLHDPQVWWLARHEGGCIGVLLVAPKPEWNSWEVAYVGITASARRQGFGRQLMDKAIAEAQRAGVTQLTLSVDARNQAAWNLYKAMDFQPFDRREVYLQIWGSHP